MEAVKETPVVNPPEIERVMRNTFGMSATSIEVCNCIVKEEDATVADIAENMDVDRSIVFRHLEDLVEIGVVTKSSQSLSDGGRANVYSSVPLDEIRRQLRISLYTWETEVEALIDDLSQEKLDAMAESRAESDDEGSSSLTEFLSDVF